MEKDPLKELFELLPEIEPDSALKNRILAQIEGRESPRQLWIWRPAIALASFILVSLLGLVTSLKLIPHEESAAPDSGLERWIQPASTRDPLTKSL